MQKIIIPDHNGNTPEEVTKRIMLLIPESTNGVDYYPNNAHIVLSVVLGAFHLFGEPYSLHSLAECLQDENAFNRVKERLELEFHDAQETQALRLLIRTRSVDGQFDFNKFSDLVAGLTSLLTSFKADELETV